MKLKEIRDLMGSKYEINRKGVQTNRYHVYTDNFKHLVREKLKEQFHEDNYDRLYWMTATFLNLFKKIVNLKSMLYKKEAVRRWLKADGETVDENFNDYVNVGQRHLAFQMLNKYVNMANVAFLRLKPNGRQIEYEAVPPQNIYVITDYRNPMKYNVLLHKIVVDQDEEENNFYIYWDREKYGILNYDLSRWIEKEQENRYFDPNKNEGVIPYVPCYGIQPLANDFWSETLNQDLYEATIQANVHLTHWNNLFKNSAYKQLIFLGLNPDDIRSLYGHVMDGATPITIRGEGADAKAETLVDDLEKSIRALRMLLSHVADQHGVEIQVERSSQSESGFAIKLKREAMKEIRQEQEPLFRECENTCAYYTAIMARTEWGAPIDINGSLDVSFVVGNAEMTKEDMEIEAWKKDEGLKSLVELFMELNPDYTEEEALEKIKENQKINRQLGGQSVLGEIEEEEEGIEEV